MHRAIEDSPVHATSVAVGGAAALIIGQSGAGKSGLALQMMALGATLVSDDQTRLTRSGAAVLADAPDAIRGQIEARYIGLLDVPSAGPVELRQIVDLDAPHAARLPQAETLSVMGVDLPLIRGADVPNLAAALMLMLRHGCVPNTSA